MRKNAKRMPEELRRKPIIAGFETGMAGVQIVPELEKKPPGDLSLADSVDEKFMACALEQAKRAFREGEIPVGAVLELDGRAVGFGRNRSIALADPTAHAEILALREGAGRIGNYRLTGSTLYVTVEPCAMCAGALVLARVKRLVYGADDPKAGFVRSLYPFLEDPRLNHRVEVTSGVLEEECGEILRRFFRERRKAFTAEDAE